MHYVYKNRFIRKNGFSLIELILVVAIISIIAASTAPFISRFLTENNLEVATDKVISTVRKSQAYAMANKDNQTWGFCMRGNSIRLYSGSCTTPTHNEDFALTRVTVNGLTDVNFTGTAGARGEPSNSVVITISNDAGVRTVSMNAAGGITIN